MARKRESIEERWIKSYLVRSCLDSTVTKELVEQGNCLYEMKKEVEFKIINGDLVYNAAEMIQFLGLGKDRIHLMEELDKAVKNGADDVTEYRDFFKSQTTYVLVFSKRTDEWFSRSENEIAKRYQQLDAIIARKRI